MDQGAFETYVAERYNKQMEYYDKTSAKNQKRYRQFQWLLIVLSAATPVLAALSGRTIRLSGLTFSVDLQILVIIISAMVAILTTVLKTFNYQELWVNYRSTYEKLKPEIHYYHFNVGPYGGMGVDKESLFVSRVEAMLDAEHNQWPPAKTLQEGRKEEESGKEERPTAEAQPEHDT